MGQVGQVSRQTDVASFQEQQMMGFALMSAFLSNDPQQMAGAFSALAGMDPRQFLMGLAMINPQLCFQLASTLAGQMMGAQGGACPSCGCPSGQAGNGDVPMSDMIMNNLLRQRSPGGDAHVVPPRNRGSSY